MYDRQMLTCLVLIAAVVALWDLAWLSAVRAEDGRCAIAEGWTRLTAPPDETSLSGSTSWRRELLTVAAGWGAPGDIYVGGRYALYRSRDCGMTWSTVWAPPLLSEGVRIAQSPERLAAAPSGRIYFDSTWPQRIMISRDSGATWYEGDRVGTSGNLAVAPSDPDTMYVFGVSTGSSRGPFPVVKRSIDGGLTWETRNQARPMGEAIVDPDDASVVYSIGQGVILRSVDGARSFDPYAVYSAEDMPVGTSMAERGIGRAAMSADASRMWFISVTGSFYRGLDRAATWQRLPNVPFDGSVRSVSASPHDIHVLFAVSQARAPGESELWVYREPAEAEARAMVEVTIAR